MKKSIKLLTLILSFMFAANSCFAININKLDKLIKKSELNETATIAISIKNAKTNSDIYESNSKKLLHPASTLKLFTAYQSLNTLGYDYSFKTQFYKDKQNNLYIKLGADPLLTTAQLKEAFQKIKDSGHNSFKNLYFDDSIIDKKEFAPGWMWDDDINPYTPKVSSYNLDGNVIKLEIKQDNKGIISTSLKSSYPMSVIANIKTEKNNNYLDIERYNWSNPEVVEIYGCLSDIKPINIPISSMRRYFIHNVKNITEDNKISFSGTLYASKLLPQNAELITEITNPISNTIPLILQNSNNLMAETIFKLAGGKKYNATGTDEIASILFKEFYKNIGVDTDKIIIKDGCGVSRNNLFYTDWITKALNKIYKTNDFEQFKDNMARPGDGTLSTRLFDLRGNAWLKTGSLSNISAVAGYIESLDGNTYSISIIIQNFTKNQKDIKSFEDEIIELIYSR